MSFFQTVYHSINPIITIHMNDIIFIMIVCFYFGRYYEQRKCKNIHFTIPAVQQYRHLVNQHNQNIEVSSRDEDYAENGWDEALLQNITQQQLHENQIQTAHQIRIEPNKKQQQRRNSVQILESQRFPSNRNMSKNEKDIKQNEKQNIAQPDHEWLKQKVKLDGQKIQEKGKFQLLFEKSKDNLNLVRKIEKHQIITDYILKKQANGYGELTLVPLKKQASFPNQNSVIEVEYYQNYNSNSVPIIEKRIIQLNQRPQISINSFIEHGKFRKLFRNIIKIGQGGFGTVYQAYNMLEGKKYAIKKIFINKNTKQIQSLLGQIKILNNLSHPNVVKYNSCWLQYAEFNEHKEYQRILEGLEKRQLRNGVSLKVVENQNQDVEEVDDQLFEQSYVSSANSGFSFARSSKEATKKSITLKNKKSVVLLKKEDEKSSNSLQNSFGLLPVMYIQMQLCQHSLAYYLKKRDTVDRIFVYQIMEQLINGVNYIHTNRIIHRDLKPQNILFATSNGSIVLKIGDFGLAVQMEGKDKPDDYMIPNTRAGTPSYIAPELYFSSVKKLNQQDLQRTDIYSLAVIYYEMLNKFSTSHERGEKLNLLKQGKIAGINEFKQQKKLIQQLIKQNRPKAKDIITSQAWKKLTATIFKAKRQMLYKNSISKKDSYSTNNTSNINSDSLSLSLSLDIDDQIGLNISKQKTKQKSKSKSRSRNRNKCLENKKLAFLQQENGQMLPQTDKNIEQQCEQQPDLEKLDHQYNQHNILLIKRSSSITSKPVIQERKISDIVEQVEEISMKGDITHPELEKQNMDEQWEEE